MAANNQPPGEPTREPALLALAQEHFGALLPAEEELFRAAQEGRAASALTGNEAEDDPANAAGWSAERIVRAECISWVCTDPRASELLTYRGLELQGMRIDGRLNLINAEIKFSLRARECAFSEHISLLDAQLRGFYLVACRIRSLNADRAIIDGPLLMRNGFLAEGEVSLKGATIRGDLDCDGAQFLNAEGFALNAEGAKITGRVSLRNGFRAEGEVCLFGATIGQTLECDGAQLLNARGLALNASSSKIEGSVLLCDSFRAEGEVYLVGARIGGGLYCKGAQFLSAKRFALAASSARIAGDIFFCDAFKAEGQVNLVRVIIGSDLNCSGAQFSNVNGLALNADGAKIEGSVRFLGGFRAEGDVNLLGATIGGNLECIGAEFASAKRVALSINGVKVSGNVFLREGFKAEGEVNLIGAKIGKDLDCSSAQFSNARSLAFTANGAHIGGAVFFCDGFKAEGEVNLIGAKIGGVLYCKDAEFSNPNAMALNASATKVDGSVFLAGSNVEGQIKLMRASIGGSLDCTGARFVNGAGFALTVDEAQVEGTLSLCDGFEARGRVVLLGATIGNLLIRGVLEAKKTTLDLRLTKVETFWDEEGSWPKAGSLFLDGFRYERFFEEAPYQADSRKKWLSLQPRDRFRPQPYEQLASVLRQMGHERDARLVMIEKNHERARFTSFPQQSWWWYNVFGRLIGYGYAPWRAFAMSAAMIVLGTLFFHLGATHDLISPASEDAYAKAPNGQVIEENRQPQILETYPVFNAFVYSLESFVPLLKLDQSANWRPNANHRSEISIFHLRVPYSGRFLRYYLYFHIAAGWLLTSLWVGAITGLMKT